MPDPKRSRRERTEEWAKIQQWTLYSCCGRCTGLNVNDKEGILTQVLPAWIPKA